MQGTLLMSERIIKFTPAWNKTDPDPSKNYGIGAMSIWFYLKGDLAVVQFHLSTRWYLPGDNDFIIGQPYKIPETRPEVLKRKREYRFLLGGDDGREVALCDYWAVKDAQEGPQGYDVGYHAPIALYEDQTPREDCEFFPAPAKCFYDGSSLRTREWAKKFVEGGTEWLWLEMENELAEIEARIREAQEDMRRFS
jgi:hypothetical protein